MNHVTVCLEKYTRTAERTHMLNPAVREPGALLPLKIKCTKERRALRRWKDPKIIIVRDMESPRTRDTARGRLSGDLDNGGRGGEGVWA